MKKIFLITFAAAALTACNSATTTENSTVNTDSVASADTNDSMSTTVNTSTTTYTPAEGDVTYKDNQLMVWRGNAWVKADDDVKMDDGVTVYKDGKVKKDNKTVTLDDGEVVDHNGNFFDKTGHAISDAWDATKKGVNEAGEAIGNAAKDTKDAIVPDKDDK